MLILNAVSDALCLTYIANRSGQSEFISDIGQRVHATARPQRRKKGTANAQGLSRRAYSGS